MKKIWGFLVALVMGILLIAGTQCKPKPPINNIPVFSSLTPIINPPDTFQIAYNLSTYGNKLAYVTFKDSSVWKISLQGSPRVSFGFISPIDSSFIFITDNDTLGFRGGVQFTFIADKNNYVVGPYFVQFLRLPINYNNFSPKY